MAPILCCCIPNQEKLEERCQKPAEFEIWYGWKPGVEDCTDACSEHLASLLDDSPRFEIVRIVQAIRVDAPATQGADVTPAQPNLP